MTELNSPRTVLVSTVTQRCEIFAACDAAYLDIPLAEISYNSAVYNESYTQKKLRGSANYGPPCSDDGQLTMTVFRLSRQTVTRVMCLFRLQKLSFSATARAQ